MRPTFCWKLPVCYLDLSQFVIPASILILYSRQAGHPHTYIEMHYQMMTELWVLYKLHYIFLDWNIHTQSVTYACAQEKQILTKN
jgi:hypothetical protein